MRKNLSRISEEIYRIKELFEDYNTDSLYTACKNFHTQKEPPKDAASALYNVRNILIHNYHKLTKKDLELLPEINKEFEKVVLDFLIKFNY